MIADRERNPRSFIKTLVELGTEVVVDSWTFPAGVEPDVDRLREAARAHVDPELVAGGMEALADVLAARYPHLSFTPKGTAASPAGARSLPGAVLADCDPGSSTDGD